MHVLCVTSNYPRWQNDSTTPFVHHLAQDLQKLGWEITVLAPHAAQTARTEIMDGIHVRRFRYLWPECLETICYKGGALANLRQAPTNYLKLPALLLSELIHVTRHLASGKYSLLHSHWLIPQGFMGAIAAKAYRIPHVITIHGSDVFALNSGIVRYCKAFALRAADVVTANSSATEKAAETIYPGVKKLVRIPMGVKTDVSISQTEVLRLREEYHLGTGPILLFTGRIVKEKGIGDLLRAMVLLRDRYPTIRLLIVGEGQDRPKFAKMTHDLGLSANVIFTGWVATERVPSFLRLGDIYVGPSWSEGQGLSFLEAMLAGIPVIGTDVGGIPDIVKHEETGLLVQVKSPSSIAIAVQRVLDDHTLALRLRENGRSLVLTSFSRDATARNFSDLFHHLIAHVR